MEKCRFLFYILLTKEKLYFRLFDGAVFLTRLSFPYFLCFAFSHLCLKASKKPEVLSVLRHSRN